MKTILENLNFRYATKKYATDKKISESEFNDILEAGRLSPSAYGVQPFKIILIEDVTLREKLRGQAYDQSPVTEASHFVVLATLKKVDEAYVDAYMNHISVARGVSVDSLAMFKERIMRNVVSMQEGDFRIWAAKQAYIALSSMLIAAAEKEIDATPMEGFIPEGFDEILDLSKKGLASCVVAAFGYRSEEDKNAFLKKVRLPAEDFVITL